MNSENEGQVREQAADEMGERSARPEGRGSPTRLLEERAWSEELPSGIPPQGTVVITIARQLGSGGSEVGRLVARRTALRYLDRQIIIEVARRLGVDVREARRLDEYTAGVAAQILEAVRASQPFTLNYAGLLGQAGRPLQQYDEVAYLHLTQKVILEMATQGNVIIVGRGSQFLLQHAPRTLHVAVFAPLPQRIARVMSALRVDQRRARELIEQRDYEYAAYLRRYYGSDGQQPGLYHLLINTGLFSFEQAADLICQALTAVSSEPEANPSSPQ
ncbi:AAA family ATPase [Thermogemmatispora carboxidivorans]|uniref:cytidylate kinase-like family protein n=1 Tax=Thermogemmatispora carboxidivorans TaxID=1382306 RepID=UPI000699BC9C|nr:cytidylate kinase-like family protein [Thermogemmatispora carboxidivorans]